MRFRLLILQPYVNVTAFEVPASVVMVTGTEGEPPGGGGSVTLHDIDDEQLVGAATPPNLAKTLPLALLKLAPDRSII